MKLADLVVMTGDFQTHGTPAARVMAADLRPLVGGLRSRDGILGVLGNHDSHDTVDALEAIGIRMLVNEHVAVDLGGAAIRFTGTDDVNRYYTPAAEAALTSGAGTGFSVALVHSAETADIAVQAGHALYLSGHTHGGQVCLPGGRPIFTALGRHRRLASGLWQWGTMIGYTSRGAGVANRGHSNASIAGALDRMILASLVRPLP